MWLFQVESAFATRSIFGVDRFPYLSSCLGEAALSWLHNWHMSARAGLTHTFTHWEEFVINIRQAFEPPRQQQLLRTQLRALKQTSTAQSYTFAFRTIMGQITRMDEEDRLAYYVHGLNSKLRGEVEVREPRDLEDAIKIAITFDQIRQNSQINYAPVQTEPLGNNSRPQNQNHGSKFTRNIQPVPMELGNISPKTKAARFRDKKPDYYTKFCSKCSRYGHTDAECRTHPANTEAKKINLLQEDVSETTQSADTETLGLAKEYLSHHNGKPNDLIMFDGLINSQRARILLDSGASYDYISQDFVERKNLHTESTTPRHVVIADGTPHKTTSIIRKAKMSIGHFNDHLDLHVFPLSTCDVILGKPFLFRFNPSVDWRTNTVEIIGEKGITVLRATRETPVSRTKFQETIQLLHKTEVNDCDVILLIKVGGQTEQLAIDSHEDKPPELSKLLTEFKSVFTEDLSSIPPVTEFDHKITLEPGAQPICLPTYRMSPKELDILRSQLDSLLAKGFIRPSKSPWGFPILFAKKKDGSLRLCVDYRALNKLTIKNRMVPPRIDELLDRLGNAKYFSKLDLSSGYHQIRIAPSDTEKTAFRTRYGHFEYTVMPFGLCNAPATFQTLMNTLFYDLIDKSVVIYLDDILVFSASMELHIIHLEAVFKRLQQHSLFVKGSKCRFLQTEIEFLGHRISPLGISVDTSKTQVIREWPTPQSTTELQSFLGLAGYYRRFIENFAGITSSLTDLLKKEVIFEWTPQHQSAFSLLKTKLSSAPVLRVPDFKKPFILSTDASIVAVGGVLSQQFDDGVHPLCYDSKKLNDTEKNYAVHELECYAIFHCMKKWRCYVEGSQLEIQTDHKSLEFLQTQKHLSRRMTRWATFLQQFDFTIRYIKGNDNIAADALSRVIVPTTLHAIVESDWPEHMMEFLSTGELPQGISDKTKQLLCSERSKFNISGDILYRVDGNRRRAFVPFVFRADLMDKFHKSNGHLALSSTLELFKARYWWPNLKEDLEEALSKCPQCQLHSSPDRRNIEELHPLSVSYLRPFSRWGLDFIGPLPKTPRGNTWLIVAIDYCTKWPIAKPLKAATAEEVAIFIENEIVLNFGIPDEIVTDRGPMFNSGVIEYLLDQFRVKHLMSSAYHPRTNGAVERYNAVIGKMISKFASSNKAQWDLYVNNCVLASRVRLHSATGYSPFYMVYGVNAKIPGDKTIPNIIEEIDNFDHTGERLAEINSLQNHRKEALASLDKQRSSMKNRFDKKLTKNEIDFKVGDPVMVRNEAKKKFEVQWFGPLIITATLNNGLYSLATLKGLPWPHRIHRDRIKAAKAIETLAQYETVPKFSSMRQGSSNKGASAAGEML